MFTSELLADSFQNFRTYRIDPWDFLTELDPGVECKSVITADRVGPNSGSTSNRVSEADAPALSPKATQNLTASERKQEKNRLAQKRFRQRKKVPFKPRSQCSKHAWDKETSFFNDLYQRTVWLYRSGLRQQKLSWLRRQVSCKR